MKFKAVSLAFLAMILSLAVPHAASAQDVSAEQRAAAQAAIAATRATDPFDAILLSASARVKDELTAADPDKAELIKNVVDEEALALAPRRGDLEDQAVTLFVNTFTKEELEQITAFYTSETGKKYLDSTPILARELNKAARIWANGINRDLTDNVTKKLFAAKSE